MKRRSLVGLLILTLAILVGVAWGDGGIVGLPWPRHVEWTQYNVTGEGWLLCRPSVPSDSTEHHVTCVTLTPGTEVYVPRIVRGMDPEAPKRQGMY